MAGTPRLAVIAGIVAVLIIVIVAFSGCTITTPNAGEIGVVRNGGPLDNHKIRQIVPNGAGNTWAGWFSDVHYYPVTDQQRFFKMESCFDASGQEFPCKGADSVAITVPTADGVDVSIEGIFYLNTVFANGPVTIDVAGRRGIINGRESLKAFDTQFATRTFDSKHAYEGTEGWSAFLGAIVEPIVANNLRETIAGVTCAELVSSCALVQNRGQAVDTSQLQSKNNSRNVARIQNAVQTNLALDLRSTLGRDYFTNIKFNVKAVKLPEKVQDAIDTAQAAFADVSQAQAKVRSAELDAQANRTREDGYRNCPTCARIDALKALPQGLQALGSPTLLGIK